MSTPSDLNRVTLHIKKRTEVTEPAEDLVYGERVRIERHGIDHKQERIYSREPDKEFKFYLATLLMLFVIIYVVQAIMLHR